MSWSRIAFPDPHYIFQLDCMSSWNIEPDELHIIHLGASPLLLGSCLWLLVFEILPGDAQTNMDTVWATLFQSYKKHKVNKQYSSIHIGSSCDPKAHTKHFTKLKGRGTEMKDLVTPMVDCWETREACNYDHKLVLSFLRVQAQMQHILT